MIEKQQQNQARDVFCHALPRTDNCSWRANMATPRHLIVFTYACGYYSRAAIISLAKLQVQLVFEGGYYSGCSFCSNKYGS